MAKIKKAIIGFADFIRGLLAEDMDSALRARTTPWRG